MTTVDANGEVMLTEYVRRHSIAILALTTNRKEGPLALDGSKAIGARSAARELRALVMDHPITAAGVAAPGTVWLRYSRPAH